MTQRALTAHYRTHLKSSRISAFGKMIKTVLERQYWLRLETKDRKIKLCASMFQCSLYGRVFLTHLLQAHSRKQKRMVTRLECLMCQTKLVSKAALVLHLKYHKPNIKYSYKSCNILLNI